MIEDIKKYYNCIASTFDNVYFAKTIYCESLKPDMLKALKAISENLEKLDVCSVLDLGCGTGYWSQYLFKHHGIDVTGVDFSENMGTIFQKNLPKAKFICDDIFNFIQKNNSKYDSIIFSFVLSHYDLQYVMQLLKYAQRQLNSDGHIVIIDSSWSSLRRKLTNKEICKINFDGKVKKYYRTKPEFEKIIKKCELEIAHSYFDSVFFNYVVNSRNGIKSF